MFGLLVLSECIPCSDPAGSTAERQSRSGNALGGLFIVFWRWPDGVIGRMSGGESRQPLSSVQLYSLLRSALWLSVLYYYIEYIRNIFLRFDIYWHHARVPASAQHDRPLRQ